MGGIESTQGEKKPLLTKAESNPPKATSVGAVGNLPPSVESIPHHSMIISPPAQALENEPARVPMLEMPRLAIESGGSIKLLPEKLAAQFSGAIYHLFFHDRVPSYFGLRQGEALEALYVVETVFKKPYAVIDFINELIELIGTCGVQSQQFLLAALQLKEDLAANPLKQPTLEEFLTDYLSFDAKPDKLHGKTATDLNQLSSTFDFVFKRLKNTPDLKLVTNLYLGHLPYIATQISDSSPSDYESARVYPALEKEKKTVEMLVLYVVLRHQQSLLSQSPDLAHLEKAAKALVLLHDIQRHVELGLPTPPDPSELIAKLAARAVEAVSQEELPDADRCAEILGTLTEVSEDAAARLAEIKAIIAQYDAEADKVAEEAKFDG
jgi:hypothetical protein